MNDNNKFFSMDKLVEFGMGIAIAAQMVNSMNKALNEIQIPGAGKVMPLQTEMVYYAVIDGKQKGPYSITELSRLIAEKKIVKETYIWKPGMKQWDLAQNISEVLSLVALTPPPLPINR
ncbi:MAG: DUF4339 domain-containing protein [Coprobacillus cateniformis]|uniref:DUF4339 domain-containing protein n=1 Tax=Longibaculum muris TaxID=1796628 RepID=UPI003AB5064E|nr:DUF4339 domain-containing protein [Coprobacillus cateniformis]